jgi:hypothetical protein
MAVSLLGVSTPSFTDTNQHELQKEKVTMVKKGFYRHFKGMLYQVVGTARSSESINDAYVVYQALYGTYELWIRPLSMFTEQVMVNGEFVDRFTYLGETYSEQ